MLRDARSLRKSPQRASLFHFSQRNPSLDTQQPTMPAAGKAGGVVGGAITLKGSANIVTEFFGYGINTILYQRGVYPPEQFERKKQYVKRSKSSFKPQPNETARAVSCISSRACSSRYGLTLLVTTDNKLKKYLNGVLQQLSSACALFQFPYVCRRIGCGATAYCSFTLFVAWLYQKTVQRVVVVIANASTGDTMERWQFDIECDKSADDSTCGNTRVRNS